MEAVERDLRKLKDRLMKEARNHGIPEESAHNYGIACNDLALFASDHEATEWSRELADA